MSPEDSQNKQEKVKVIEMTQLSEKATDGKNGLNQEVVASKTTPDHTKTDTDAEEEAHKKEKARRRTRRRKNQNNCCGKT